MRIAFKPGKFYVMNNYILSSKYFFAFSKMSIPFEPHLLNCILQLCFSSDKQVHYIVHVIPCGSTHGWMVSSGPVSQTGFPSQFKFDVNFVSLQPQFLIGDLYKISYMTRQLWCRGMCKKLLWSDCQQRNYSKANLPPKLNCGQTIVSETGPGAEDDKGQFWAFHQITKKTWILGRLGLSCFHDQCCSTVLSISPILTWIIG